MNEDLVPQDVVTAILLAIAYSRPVLFTPRDIVRQVELAISHLTGDDITGNVIACSQDMTWTTLSAKLSKCAGVGIVLRRVDRLNRDVQLHLGYAIVERIKHNSSTLVVCTSVQSPDSIHPTLRKLILVKQDIDLDNARLPRVELRPVAGNSIEKSIMQMKDRVPTITIVPELQRYMEDIVMFVRSHRLVRGGLTPQVVQDFYLVVRTLCVLHEMHFATPLIIKKAAKLVLPLKVRFVSAEDEPSLQYGGDLDMVRVWIREWDSDMLVDSVLNEVPVPQ